ncbi:LacI family DNA-binding transcriptional regulator [Limimaricola cinnabarinus]|uniref:LacI family DNA-binding transcriptional regulator n=1 Tax=Limimaricola cinnabarinus TaxID=1125964 RepID=UPI0005ECFB0F|nr:substrate-binding domain-containing protein [Limimaricola cinnabarinus]
MAHRPKLSTVAAAAGVSPATVSQVLRGTGRISEETRARVLEAARAVNYLPDGRAAAMRSGENREIGLVLHHLANPFNAELVSGVSDRLERDGYLVSVLDSRDDAERQERNLRALIANMRGGLIWVPASGTDAATLDLLAAQRLPVVTFLHRVSPDLDHVELNNARALRDAVAHLADLGHRRIAFLGGTAPRAPRTDRIAGYLAAVAERGLGAPLVWPCEDSRRGGRDAILSLRAAHPDIGAVVCNGDMVALGACLGLASRGERAGREVSIIGFDDVAEAALATPALTTLSVMPYDLGRRLAERLLARMSDPAAAPTTLRIDATLVPRDTTAPPSPRRPIRSRRT